MTEGDLFRQSLSRSVGTVSRTYVIQGDKRINLCIPYSISGIKRPITVLKGTLFDACWDCLSEP